MNITEIANNICENFLKVSEVQSAHIYGSIANGSFDEYSDIDIELDLSGHDNGAFLKKAAEELQKQYPVIFSDYAPSLLPEEYVVSCAISEDNPFLIVDIKCTANPHVYSLSKKDIRNDKYTHILKLWVANMKHYLRGYDCKNDICRMYQKIFNELSSSPENMLIDVFEWLNSNSRDEYRQYLSSCKTYVEKISR